MSEEEPIDEVSASNAGEASAELRSANLRAIRLGHGANCSSIGSVVDTLFASAVIGGAVLAAVMAAMKNEPVTVVGPSAESPAAPPGAGESVASDAERRTTEGDEGSP